MSRLAAVHSLPGHLPQRRKYVDPERGLISSSGGWCCSALPRNQVTYMSLRSAQASKRCINSYLLPQTENLSYSSASNMKTPTNSSGVMQATPTSGQSELSEDELQLRAQGHVGELPRQFGAFATLSLAFSITNSWVGYSAVFATPLFAGGGPTVFFGLSVATIACCFITAGLAELASAFPSSGGQYQYVPLSFAVVAWCLTFPQLCFHGFLPELPSGNRIHSWLAKCDCLVFDCGKYCVIPPS